MIIASAASLPFVLNAGFGQPPQGERLTEVEASPQYREGKFHNTLPTPGYNGDKNMLVAMWEFLTKKTENARPAQPLPLVKTDLASLPLEQDTLVWLGHSSWYLQLAGKRILIDPVLGNYAAPFSFLNKAFAGDRPADYLARSLRSSGLRHYQGATAEGEAGGHAAGRGIPPALLGDEARDY